MSRRRKISLTIAFRARKGMIGILECCQCAFPIERFATSTRHDDQPRYGYDKSIPCPAHLMILSGRELAAADPSWAVALAMLDSLSTALDDHVLDEMFGREASP